jgi:hypothetical protein
MAQVGEPVTSTKWPKQFGWVCWKQLLYMLFSLINVLSQFLVYGHVR